MRLSMVEGDTTCAASAANRREWKHGTYVEAPSWLKNREYGLHPRIIGTS